MISFPFHIFAPIVCHPRRRDSSRPPLSISIPALCTAGLSHKEQVGSSSLTSGHYRCHTRSERGLAPTWTGTKSSSKTFRITASAFTRSPRRSLAVIIFIRPLSLLPLQREARGSERGGGIVYLTLICSVVSFGEMTGNLGGKGQLFLSLLFRGPIYRPRALLPPHLPKLQTISGCGMLLWVHSCGQGLKEETPSRSLSPSPFPGSLNFIRPSLSASFSWTAL